MFNKDWIGATGGTGGTFSFYEIEAYSGDTKISYDNDNIKWVPTKPDYGDRMFDSTNQNNVIYVW